MLRSASLAFSLITLVTLTASAQIYEMKYSYTYKIPVDSTLVKKFMEDNSPLTMGEIRVSENLLISGSEQSGKFVFLKEYEDETVVNAYLKAIPFYHKQFDAVVFLVEQGKHIFFFTRGNAYSKREPAQSNEPVVEYHIRKHYAGYYSNAPEVLNIFLRFHQNIMRYDEKSVVPKQSNAMPASMVDFLGSPGQTNTTLPVQVSITDELGELKIQERNAFSHFPTTLTASYLPIHKNKVFILQKAEFWKPKEYSITFTLESWKELDEFPVKSILTEYKPEG